MTLWIHEDESLQALAQQDALLHAWLSVSRQRQASGLEDPEALAIEALAAYRASRRRRAVPPEGEVFDLHEHIARKIRGGGKG